MAQVEYKTIKNASRKVLKKMPHYGQTPFYGTEQFLIRLKCSMKGMVLLYTTRDLTVFPLR